MTGGRVVLDLVAPQSPSYRGRGIARHGLAFAAALVEGHGDLVEQVLVHPELPPAGGMEGLIATGKVGAVLDASLEGGIFHVTSPFEPELASRVLWPRAASARRMRLAVTVYDLIPDVFPEMYLQDPGLRRRWRCGREIVRAADHVFTLSESGRDDVTRMLGVDGDKVSVIGSGCDDRFHPPADRELSRTMAQTSIPGLGRRYLVCNGAIDPRKNLTRLVESFALLPVATRAELQLVIVCRATVLERNHFWVMAERLGVGGQVLLPGFVTDEILVALYQSAELTVFPSLYEGYGLPVIEAQACGALVVAGDNSSLREITPAMARFDATDVSSMASVVDRAITDTAFRARLRQETAGPVPTWSDVADRATEGYERLLARDRRTRPWVPGWRARPAVAVVYGRAQPPDSSWLHDAALAEALAEVASVDVFTGGVNKPTSGAHGSHGAAAGERDPVHPVAAHPRLDRWRGGYDATVVCLSDDASSAEGLQLLERLSGEVTVVLAHDASLVEAYSAAAPGPGTNQTLSSVLDDMYPGAANLGLDGAKVGIDGSPLGMSMTRAVIRQSTRYLVRSAFEAQLARVEAGGTGAEHVQVLPWSCPPVERPPAVGEAGVAVLEPRNAPEAVLEMLAAIRVAHPGTRLLVIGGRSQRDRWSSACAAAGLTGAVDADAWDGTGAGLISLLRSARLAVSWPATPTGTAPYSLAVALAEGVPVVAAGRTHESLQDAVEHVVTEGSSVAGPGDLADVVSSVMGDPVRLGALGEAGQSFAAAHGFTLAADAVLAAAGTIMSAARGPRSG